jgi:cell division protein ZapA
MADVRLNIASREYIVTCRDGEELHLQSLASTVNDMVQEAGGATGGLNESRQLLFAALLLADKLHELQSSKPAAESQMTATDEIGMGQAAATIEKLADRLEALAVKLEN